MVKLNEITDYEETQKLPFDVAEDLIVFMQNDPMFYRKTLYPAMVDAQETTKKGKKISKKSFIPIIDQAINIYVNRYNIDMPPEEVLNDQEKLECISRLLADEAENFQKGEY